MTCAERRRVWLSHLIAKADACLATDAAYTSTMERAYYAERIGAWLDEYAALEADEAARLRAIDCEEGP